MQILNIGSGSSGNATLVYDGETLIQIDAGLPSKKIKEGLASLNKTLNDVRGLFITHSHSDHLKYANIYPKEKIFTHNDCLPLSELEKDNILFPNTKYILGTFEITPILLSHDVKCFGYVVHSTITDETLVNITDTGYIPDNSFEIISNADFYIFESNHDTDMELNSPRPAYLIKRNMSDTGHLNNIDSSYYLSLIVGNKTKTILFAHLSRDCNREDLVLKAYKDVFLAQKGSIPDIEVYCLHQDLPTFIQTKVK